jgi:hypothetical protein
MLQVGGHQSAARKPLGTFEGHHSSPSLQNDPCTLTNPRDTPAFIASIGARPGESDFFARMFKRRIG